MIYTFKIRRVSIPLVSDGHEPFIFGSLSELRKGKYSDYHTVVGNFHLVFLENISYHAIKEIQITAKKLQLSDALSKLRQTITKRFNELKEGVTSSCTATAQNWIECRQEEPLPLNDKTLQNLEIHISQNGMLAAGYHKIEELSDTLKKLGMSVVREQPEVIVEEKQRHQNAERIRQSHQKLWKRQQYHDIHSVFF